jgi:hypothetical protein
MLAEARNPEAIDRSGCSIASGCSRQAALFLERETAMHAAALADADTFTRSGLQVEWVRKQPVTYVDPSV